MNSTPLKSGLSQAEHDKIVAAYDAACAAPSQSRRARSIASLLRAANAIKAGREGVNDFTLPGCGGVSGLDLLEDIGLASPQED